MNDAKRRDNKGRLLRTGESQRDDGRYMYRYKDPYGKVKTVYSWRLTSTDSTPAGKRKGAPLRDMIREIENDMKLGLYTTDMTVCELVDKYLTTKTGVAYSTRQGYQFVQNILAKEPFGQRKIAEVKTSDAKIFLINRTT